MFIYKEKDEANICEISKNITYEILCAQKWLNVNKLSLNVS